MRTRAVWLGTLLVALCVGWGSTARAAIWPLSLFTKPPPPPVKRHKHNTGKPRPSGTALPGTVVSK